MISSNNTRFQHWYIVSFLGISSDLVGGKRSTEFYNFLNDKGTKVNLISTIGHSSDANQIKISNPLGQQSLFSRFISLLSPLDGSLFWGIRVNRFLKTKTEGILLTSFPPFGICIVGLLLKKRKNFFWIADFRDPWTINPLFKPVFYPYKMFFARRLEKKLFQKADLILLNTKMDCQNYKQKYPFAAAKCITVRNGFNKVINNKALVRKDKSLKIVYAGGSYKNGQVPKAIAVFLKEIKQTGLEITCDYYGEFHPAVERSHFISYKGSFPQTDIPEILSRYKMGIIYLPEENIGSGRIVQKFYDYIGSGVAPIVLNPSLQMEQQMESLQTGLTVYPDYDSSIIAKKIIHLSLSEIKIPIEKIIPYQRKYQFEKLFNYIINCTN